MTTEQIANAPIVFTQFPTELTEDQLLDLSDEDEADGYGMQDVIVLKTGFYLENDDRLSDRQAHYLELYNTVTSSDDEDDDE